MSYRDSWPREDRPYKDIAHEPTQIPTGSDEQKREWLIRSVKKSMGEIDRELVAYDIGLADGHLTEYQHAEAHKLLHESQDHYLDMLNAVRNDDGAEVYKSLQATREKLHDLVKLVEDMS